MEKYNIKKDNIAGAVVLYNSSCEVLYNIQTYINQISVLYVIDNSTEYNKELLEEFKKFDNLIYISLQGNRGVATALNYAAQQALSDGYLVLLTMDDDTQVPSNMIRQMIEFWNSYHTNIGILSGVHHIRLDNTIYRTVPYTLTSGNLLNLRVYQNIGAFRDDFFIDHVDHEYGLRLNNNGYQIVEVPSIRLIHRLGYSQQLKVGSYVIGNYGSHSPTRLYYFARNGIYLARQNFTSRPFFAWMVFEEISKRFIKASLLQDDRRNRIKMLIKGLKDGWSGKLGRLSL